MGDLAFRLPFLRVESSGVSNSKGSAISSCDKTEGDVILRGSLLVLAAIGVSGNFRVVLVDLFQV